LVSQQLLRVQGGAFTDWCALSVFDLQQFLMGSSAVHTNRNMYRQAAGLLPDG